MCRTLPAPRGRQKAGNVLPAVPAAVTAFCLPVEQPVQQGEKDVLHPGASWGAGGGGGGRAGRALHSAPGRAGHTSLHHGDTVQPASSWPCPTLALLAALGSPGSPCHAPLPPHTHLLWVTSLLILSLCCPCPTPSQGGLPPGPQVLISGQAAHPAPLWAGDTRTALSPGQMGGTSQQHS